MHGSVDHLITIIPSFLRVPPQSGYISWVRRELGPVGAKSRKEEQAQTEIQRVCCEVNLSCLDYLLFTVPELSPRYNCLLLARQCYVTVTQK